MKRLFYSIALGAVTLSSAIAAAETVNLRNANFDEGAEGWYAADNDNGMSKITAEAAETGDYGLRVTDSSDASGSNFRSTRFAVTPGETVTVTFRARCVSGSGIGVYLHFWDGDDQLIGRDAGGTVVCSIPKNSPDWKTYTITAVVPSGAVKGELQIHSYNKSKVTADFDSFKVEKGE